MWLLEVQQVSAGRCRRQHRQGGRGEKMYKDRTSALAAEERGNARGEGPLYRDAAGNKKRLEEAVEKPSPSTSSKGGIGKEKEKDRLAPGATAAAAAAAQPRRYAGQVARPALEKAKFPDDGELPDCSGRRECRGV